VRHGCRQGGEVGRLVQGRGGARATGVPLRDFAVTAEELARRIEERLTHAASRGARPHRRASRRVAILLRRWPRMEQGSAGSPSCPSRAVRRSSFCFSHSRCSSASGSPCRSLYAFACSIARARTSQGLRIGPPSPRPRTCGKTPRTPPTAESVNASIAVAMSPRGRRLITPDTPASERVPRLAPVVLGPWVRRDREAVVAVAAVLLRCGGWSRVMPRRSRPRNLFRVQYRWPLTDV
jgi:hypothetical protein